MPFTFRYYGKFELKSGQNDFGSGFFSHILDFGNKELFSESYRHLKFFHEYKINHADITITWDVVRVKAWEKGGAESAAFEVVSFIEDYDARENTGSVVWDDVASHPAARTGYTTTFRTVRTRHHWRPTEPTDKDWRLTQNDGLCSIYLCARPADAASDLYEVIAVVEVRASIKLRDFDLVVQSSVLKTLAHKVTTSTPDLDSQSDRLSDSFDRLSMAERPGRSK